MAWQERARAARAVLVDQYWDSRTGLMRIDPGLVTRLRWLTPWGPWHYWWQALAVEALCDGFEAGDPRAGEKVERLLAGVARRSGGDPTANVYYDDLSWLGLAAARAHRLGLAPGALVTALADAALAGFDDEYGGVRWRVGDEFHNVPATAPDAMLQLAAADLDSDPARAARRIDRARGAAEWLHTHLVDPTGVVWDGARPRDGVLVPEGRLWSYNVGTVAGLDVALAQRAAPEGRRLLARARHVLRGGTAALRMGTDDVGHSSALLEGRPPGGPVAVGVGVRAWRDELTDGSSADPQLFRGILAAHLARTVMADPHRTADLAIDLASQASAAWRARDPVGRIGPRWADPGASDPAGAGPTLASHLAGVLTVGAAARLEARGLLP